MRHRFMVARQQWVEFAGSFKGVQLIISAHMTLADPNLWNRREATCTLAHLGTCARIEGHIDLFVRGPLFGEERLCGVARRDRVWLSIF